MGWYADTHTQELRRESVENCVPNRVPTLTEKKRETWREYESGAGVDFIFSAFPSVDVMPAIAKFTLTPGPIMRVTADTRL